MSCSLFACTKTFLADTLCCSDGFGLTLDDSQDEGSEDNDSGLSWTKAIEARDGTRTEKAHSTVAPLAQRDGDSIAGQNGVSNMLGIVAEKKKRAANNMLETSNTATVRQPRGNLCGSNSAPDATSDPTYFSSKVTKIPTAFV